MSFVLSRGRLVLFPKHRVIFWDDHEVKLTRSQCAVVEILVSSPGTTLDGGELYRLLRARGLGRKGERDGYEVMRSTIRHIRNHFKAVDPTFAAIKTVRNKGYRWQRTEMPRRPFQVEGAEFKEAA